MWSSVTSGSSCFRPGSFNLCKVYSQISIWSNLYEPVWFLSVTCADCKGCEHFFFVNLLRHVYWDNITIIVYCKTALCEKMYCVGETLLIFCSPPWPPLSPQRTGLNRQTEGQSTNCRSSPLAHVIPPKTWNSVFSGKPEEFLSSSTSL